VGRGVLRPEVHRVVSDFSHYKTKMDRIYRINKIESKQFAGLIMGRLKSLVQHLSKILEEVLHAKLYEVESARA
jgi:hypothetical protein